MTKQINWDPKQPTHTGNENEDGSWRVLGETPIIIDNGDDFKKYMGIVGGNWVLILRCDSTFNSDGITNNVNLNRERIKFGDEL